MFKMLACSYLPYVPDLTVFMLVGSDGTVHLLSNKLMEVILKWSIPLITLNISVMQFSFPVFQVRGLKQFI